MGAWEFGGETVDVVEMAVRFICVFLVQFIPIEGLIIELSVVLDQVFWDWCRSDRLLGLDLRNCLS